MKAGIIRQGDVCLVPVAKLPANAKQEKIDGPVVLAWGEVTFHSHQIKDHANVTVWSAGAERFIKAAHAVQVTHEEHHAATLEPGVIYKQLHQVEDFGEYVRAVAD